MTSAAINEVPPVPFDGAANTSPVLPAVALLALSSQFQRLQPLRPLNEYPFHAPSTPLRRHFASPYLALLASVNIEATTEMVAFGT